MKNVSDENINVDQHLPLKFILSNLDLQQYQDFQTRHSSQPGFKQKTFLTKDGSLINYAYPTCLLSSKANTVSKNECRTPSKERYGNEVSLNEQNLFLNFCQSLN